MAAVGAVLSKVTDEPSPTVVTAVPAFPIKSVKAILNVIAPSVSPDWVAKAAVQLLPEGLLYVTEPLTALPPDLKVTVGVEIASEAVKLKVTVSPVFALAVLELLDAMVTALKVGATVL